jgi:hypothetical protein
VFLKSPEQPATKASSEARANEIKMGTVLMDDHSYAATEYNLS